MNTVCLLILVANTQTHVPQPALVHDHPHQLRTTSWAAPTARTCSHPLCAPPHMEPTGDVTGDGLVNIFDLVTTVNIIMSNGYDPVVDMNSDGFLNIFDILTLVQAIIN